MSDNLELAPRVHPNTPDQIKRARRAVASAAHDAADCSFLLDMLGLGPAQRSKRLASWPTYTSSEKTIRDKYLAGATIRDLRSAYRDLTEGQIKYIVRGLAEQRRAGVDARCGKSRRR